MKLECGIKCSISELEEGSKYGGLLREFSEGRGGGVGGTHRDYCTDVS